MIRIFSRYVFILCGFILTGSGLQGQVLNQVKQTYELKHQKTFRERLFVHTDKEVYLTGELLWFKVYYLADTVPGRRPVSSKLAYVDILDKDNNAIMQAKVALNTGNGSFVVPVSARNGSYKLRAYTNWMKNAGPEVFFEKQVILINPLQVPEKALNGSAENDLQFFPEGGDLVEGIPGKVAFKATGKDGRGLNLKGVVINQNNDTVARFETRKFGIGNFMFVPKANQTYKAVAQSPDRDIVIKELPSVKKEGFVLSLKDNGTTGIAVSVQTNTATDVAYLLIHQHNSTIQSQSLSLNGKSATVTVDKTLLRDGLSTFTLFNRAGVPVAERLYFKRPVSMLNLTASADQPAYKTRENVKIQISAKNETGKPLVAKLSLSVHRLDSLAVPARADIVSSLWLKPEIKGLIESPDYYFNGNSGSDEALDNLLLTQGWRHFNSDKLSQANDFNFLPELNGHLISARLKKADGTPAKNILTYMGVTGKRLQYYGSRSDSTGKVLFNTKDFYGSNELVLQNNNEVDSNYQISLESPFSAQYNDFTIRQFEFMPSMLNALKIHSLGVQVQNIYAGNKLRHFYLPGMDSSAFYGRPYKTYMLDDYTRFTTMEEVMREYISEVDVVRRQQRFHIKMVSETRYLDGDPLVLLDGIPIFNIDKVMAINPLKVERLDVVRDQYYWGPTTAQGIMNFTTFEGDFGGTEIDSRSLVVDYEGMQLQREFYSPSYETEAKRMDRQPDFRNVLYWSGDLSTNKEGSSQASFYTSDQPGMYVGELVGLTERGIPGTQRFVFEVK